MVNLTEYQDRMETCHYETVAIAWFRKFGKSYPVGMVPFLDKDSTVLALCYYAMYGHWREAKMLLHVLGIDLVQLTREPVLELPTVTGRTHTIQGKSYATIKFRERDQIVTTDINVHADEYKESGRFEEPLYFE